MRPNETSPLIYEDSRYVQHNGMDDPVEAVKELSKKVGEATDQLGTRTAAKMGARGCST